MPIPAAAVSDAGGLGMVSPPMVPADDVAVTVAALAKRTAGPVGINFLIPFLDVAAVEAAARHCQVVEFFYGDPQAGLVERVHVAGALACASSPPPSPGRTRPTSRHWSRRQRRTP
jgi:hypothetical protein